MRTQRADCRRPRSRVKVSSILGGTPIGSMTQYGGLAAAFDGNISQAAAACAGLASVSGYNVHIGKQWGRSVLLTGVAVYGPNNTGISDSGSINCRVEGSIDGAAWTTLHTGLPTGTGASTLLNFALTGEDAHLFHRINFNASGVSGVYVAEVLFYGLEVA